MRSATETTLDLLRQATIGSEYESRLFLVGGYVRDQLLKLPVPEDLDIVLEGDALELAHFLYRQRICDHTPVVYPRFGTAMVSIDGVPVELVTARRESYQSESRHPDVVPATLADDARRRDFTINTLMRNLHTNELIDPLQVAILDLSKGVLRTPLDPIATFSDDPLRMLRAIRFAVKLNFVIVPECYEAIKETAPRLEIISEERIRDEFIKIMALPNCTKGIAMLFETGLLQQFAPELTAMRGMAQNDYHIYDVWDHTMAALDVLNPNTSTETRIALLFHDVGKPLTYSQDANERVHFYNHEVIGADITHEVLQRLKFPNSQIAEIADMVRLHMRVGGYDPSWNNAAMRRLVRDVGDLFEPMLDLCKADAKARREDLGGPDFESLEERVAKVRADFDVTKAVSPLSGEEIMEHLHLIEGPKVGYFKDALTDAIIEGILKPDDKEGAYKLLDQIAEGLQEKE